MSNELATSNARIALALETIAAQAVSQTALLGKLRGELEACALTEAMRYQADEAWRTELKDTLVTLVTTGHVYVDSYLVPLATALGVRANAAQETVEQLLSHASDVGCALSDVYTVLARLEQRYNLAADDQRQAGGSVAAALDDVAGAIRNHR